MTSARQIYLGSRRGPYDAEVEYLESTGTQWIDTGWHGNFNSRLEIVFEKNNNQDNYAICGFLQSGSSAQMTVPVNAYDDGLYARFGDKYITNGIDVSIGKHTISSDRIGITVDSVLRGTFGATADFTTPSSLALFRFKGLARNFFIGRMFSCRFYDGGTLVRDFQPVRFTNELGRSEGAMYDRVSGQLFRNAGTGAFNYGNDK